MKRYEDFFKEAQQYSTILKNYEENGEIFTDPNFHPDFEITEPKIKIDNENFTWRRIDEFYTAPLFKKEFIRPDDIDEGQLCDSGLISVLSWTATKPERVRQLFSVQTPPKQPETADLRCGAVVIQLHAFGRTTPILIDTRVPFLKGTRRPAFSRPRRFGCSPWFCLVEKAVAKIFGGYSAVSGIDMPRASYTVLGYLPQEITRDFSSISSCIDSGGVVLSTAEIEKVGEGPVTELGLVEGGVYLVAKARQASGRNFLLLRSPRSSIEWLGGWSSTSVEMTNEIRSKIGIVGGMSGTFCMVDTDFFSHFKLVYAASQQIQQQHAKMVKATLRNGQFDGCEVNSPTAKIECYQTFAFKINGDVDKSDVKVIVNVEKRGPPDSYSEESAIDVVVAFSDGQKITSQNLSQFNHQIFTSKDRIFTFTFNVTDNSSCVIVFNRNTKRSFTEECYATFSCSEDFEISGLEGNQGEDLSLNFDLKENEQTSNSLDASDRARSEEQLASCAGFSDNDVFNYSSEEDIMVGIEREITNLFSAESSTFSVPECLENLKELANDSQTRIEEKVPLVFSSIRSLVAAASDADNFLREVCCLLHVEYENCGYESVLSSLRKRLEDSDKNDAILDEEEEICDLLNDQILFNSEKSQKQTQNDESSGRMMFIIEEEEEEEASNNDSSHRESDANHLVELPDDEKSPDANASSEIVFDSLKIESENRNETASNEEENSAKNAESSPPFDAICEESQVEFEVEFEGENQQFNVFECNEKDNVNDGNEVLETVRDDFAINQPDSLEIEEKPDETNIEQIINSNEHKLDEPNTEQRIIQSNEDKQNETNTEQKIKQTNEENPEETNKEQKITDKQEDTNTEQNKKSNEPKRNANSKIQSKEKPTTQKNRKLRSIQESDGDLSHQPVIRNTSNTKDSKHAESNPAPTGTSSKKRGTNQPKSREKTDVQGTEHQLHTPVYVNVAEDGCSASSSSPSKGVFRVRQSDDPEKPFEVTREERRRPRRSSSNEKNKRVRNDSEKVSFSEPIKKFRSHKPAVGVKITIHDPDDQAEISVTKMTTKRVKHDNKRGDRLNSSEKNKHKHDDENETKRNDEPDLKDKKSEIKHSKKKKEKDNEHKSSEKVNEPNSIEKVNDSKSTEKVNKPKPSEKVHKHKSTEKANDADKLSEKSDKVKKRSASKEKPSRRSSSVKLHDKRTRKTADNEKVTKNEKPPTEVEISVAFDRSNKSIPVNDYSSVTSTSDSGLFFPFSATYKNLLFKRRRDYGFDEDDDFNFVGDDFEFDAKDRYCDTRLGYEREYFSLKTGGAYTNPGKNCRRRNPSVSFNPRPAHERYVNFLGLQSNQINCSYLPKRINWF